MPVLVSLADLKLYLGDAPTSADDALLTELLDNVEAMFATECGRSIESFVDEDSQVEVHDGTGSAQLFLDYPIEALTSVKLGYNSASPDETLSVTDKTVLVWGEGARVITRVDGGRFGTVGQPRFVEVAYDNFADIPENAQLAIKEVTASVYRNRGSEGTKSETLGSFYSYTIDDVQGISATNATWQIAVAANSRVVLR